jgi:hypothetical protein
MSNPYKNIRYFPQPNKFAVMDGENLQHANIVRLKNGKLAVYDTLEEALTAKRG